MARRFTEKELSDIVSDYNNGMTPKEMSEKYNRNSGTIIGKLKSIGVYKNTKHRFTDKDIEILREYYPKGDFDKIFEEIPDTTMSSVVGTCNKLGISKNSRNNDSWTNEDLSIIKEYYHSNTLDEIREMICNRHSNDSIRAKALKRFGYRKNYGAWSDEELDILYRYYPIESVDDVCARLPRRTRQAVIRRANNLGIKSKSYSDMCWSDDDINFLIDNWKKMSDKELADYFGRKPHAIVDKRGALGLSRVKHYNEASYHDIKKFIRGNIGEWKSESMKKCNYRCVLTGSKDDFQIHHLYGVVSMLNDVVEENNIVLKENFNDYTPDELDYILGKFIEKQNQYPLGVCVRSDLHKLFHRVYGQYTTPDMWYRFVEQYKNGEYQDCTNQVK